MILTMMIAAVGIAGGENFPIRINQIGYLPQAAKICTVKNPPEKNFYLQKGDTDIHWHTVYVGEWKAAKSGSGLMEGDFSSVTEPGDYRILLTTNGVDLTGYMPNWHPEIQSYYFQIWDRVYDLAERVLFNYAIYQRCGSERGWAGMCHQDLVPLLDASGKTVKYIDARGGYHQSNDLRSWHDGIPESFYSMLRYAELSADKAQIDEVRAEIRRACDYLLKVISPEGYVYDAQFAPIGWGPTHYYVAPATLGAQCNVTMLFTRASRFFRGEDAAYADRLLATAKGIWKQIEENDFFAEFRPAPEPNLPLGAQPAEKCYRKQYRTSAAGLSERAATALELYRVTKDMTLAEKAQTLARQFLPALEKEGKQAFIDWSYCFEISGLRLRVELYRTFGTAEWREVLEKWVNTTVEGLDRRDMRPEERVDMVPASACARNAIMLTEAARLLGRPELKVYAQRELDWIFGANPQNASYAESIGQNQFQRPVFGQFFPSTPQIPGGILNVDNGEYDMPPVMMTLWALAEVGK